MNFAWPYILLLLLLIPLLIALYIWILRRKRKFAVRYSSLSLIREALPKHTQWRKHLPFALFLVSAACLIIALARPRAAVELPLSRTTIVLAMDVSRSMCATDVEPNRLTVAQDAALAFIEEQADDTRIGIVAFAGFAEVVVPPTNDKEVLKQAIENFTTSIGTAIGSATLRSIDAIAEINDAVFEMMNKSKNVMKTRSMKLAIEVINEDKVKIKNQIEKIRVKYITSDNSEWAPLVDAILDLLIKVSEIAGVDIADLVVQ